VLFSEVVAASAAVGATRSRTAKAATLAALLRAAAPAEVEPATAWLAGETLQGRVGTGWRTLSGIEAAPAERPTLTVGQVDATLDALATTTGAGSTKRRAELLRDLFAAATRDEQRLLSALLGCELRQGALEGVMLEAVAAAAEVPAAVVRRAFMLSGRLPETARLALDGGAPALAGVTM
jgi:DNA ligase 1